MQILYSFFGKTQVDSLIRRTEGLHELMQGGRGQEQFFVTFGVNFQIL